MVTRLEGETLEWLAEWSHDIPSQNLQILLHIIHVLHDVLEVGEEHLVVYALCAYIKTVLRLPRLFFKDTADQNIEIGLID